MAEFVGFGDVADALVGTTVRQYLTAALSKISINVSFRVRVSLVYTYILTFCEEPATAVALVLGILGGDGEGDEGEK